MGKKSERGKHAFRSVALRFKETVRGQIRKTDSTTKKGWNF